MPELPEVETTVRRLRPAIAGAVIRSVSVKWPRSIAAPGPALFQRRLSGSRIVAAARRGKFIVLELVAKSSEPLFLLVHLRMSGRFYVADTGRRAGPHARVVLRLAGGGCLVFNDPRKFGRMYLVSDPETITGGLGCEPLARTFTARRFAALIKSYRRVVKPLLLDQRVLAGVGNIYADEALWSAGIHPLRHASSLTAAELARLYRALRAVLRAAIENEGTDSGDGVVVGRHRPRVYGREAEPCLRCGSTIQKLRVGQRGTHVCPRCQRPPRAASAG